MKTTAIVTCYNKQNSIEAVVSALKECKAIDKILVCDDASGDNSAEILKSLANNKTKIYTNKTNKGVAEARNFLLDKVETELVAFVDGDDVVNPTEKDKQIEYMKKHHADFCYSSYLRGERLISAGEYSDLKLKCSNFIPFSSVVAKTSALGGNRFYHIHHEDYQFWISCLIGKKLKIAYFPETTFRYGMGAPSQSSSLLRGALATLAIQIKNFGFIPTLLRYFPIYCLTAAFKRWRVVSSSNKSAN